MLTRRLAALVVAAALALAPVALEACQAVCALHPTTAAAPAVPHHSCHDQTSPSQDRAEMRGLPHSCAHSDGLPAACGAAGQPGPAAPAVVPVVASFRAPARNAAPAFDTTPSTSPPRTANAGQLRV